MHFVKATLYFVFGLLGFVLGSAIFTWVAYNLMWPQPDPAFARASLGPLHSALGLVQGFFMGAVGLYWISRSGVGRFWRRRD